MIGKSILHYKIIEKLGEGGMGIVYLAEDSKLKRQVAIKFLPGHISSNSDQRKRFEIEAQAAAALNHPNIATIHNIEEVDNDVFLVMEYIRGKHLKDHINSKALSIDEVVKTAIQIAEGLQAAHNRGIVHRDIKSANIMSTSEGKVKIMDFGLAKFGGSAQLTQIGTTLGTAAYMSPEQAKGEEVDKQADMWSFGIVLYEMLTGTLPFKGDYEQAVIYSILNEEPDFSILHKQNIPEQLINLIERTLNKNPAGRFPDMSEVIAILSGKEKLKEKVDTKKQYIIYSVLSLFILILLFWNMFGERDSDSARVETKLTKLTFDPGLEDEATWSPDGKFIAYTTDDKDNFDIIVKPVDGGNSIRIVDNKADDAQPAWSPDGKTIAFVSSRDNANHLSIIIDQAPLTQFLYAKNADIYIVPALGGSQVKIAEDGCYPQWSPDSKKIVYMSQSGFRDWNIWIKPIAGGEALKITDSQFFDYHPSWSKDGKWIIYCTLAGQTFQLNTVAETGGDPIVLLETESWMMNPRFSEDGNFIYISLATDGIFNLFKIPFSPNDPDAGENKQSITISETHDVNCNLETGGEKLVYTGITNIPDIYQLDLKSNQITALTNDNAYNDYGHLSPDGSKLLYTSDRSGRLSIWIKDFKKDELYDFTGMGVLTGGRWSPDGKSVLFRYNRGLAIKKIGDANINQIVFTASGIAPFASFSSSGNKIAYIDSGVAVYDMQSKETIQLTTNRADNDPSWSPDDKKIIFHRGQGSGRNLYHIDLSGNETQLTSSASEDSHPHFSPINKDEVLFIRDHKNLFLLSLSTGEEKQITNYARANITLDYPSFSYDGKKVIFSRFNKIGDIYILENF